MASSEIVTVTNAIPVLMFSVVSSLSFLSCKEKKIYFSKQPKRKCKFVHKDVGRKILLKWFLKKSIVGA
jgi:hypothetical protein